MYKKRGFLYMTIASCILLTSCMTDATQQRFTAEGANSQTCKMKVLDAKIAIAKYKSEEVKAQNIRPMQFKNEQNMLIFSMFQTMGDTQVALIENFGNKGKSDIDSCDDVIVAMVKADAAKVAGLNRTGLTTVKWVAGLIGLGIISDNWSPSNYNDGQGSGDIWNVSGSRVNSKSGNASGNGTANASSSGDGLGLGNTFNTGDGQAVGGLEPRTTNANGAVTDLTTGSNSGENAPIATPEAPEVQPVE